MVLARRRVNLRMMFTHKRRASFVRFDNSHVVTKKTIGKQYLGRGTPRVKNHINSYPSFRDFKDK